MNRFEVFSFTFSTSQPLAGPIEAGLDAIGFSLSGSNSELMYMVFALFPPEMQENFGSDNAQLIDYFKSTFMATSKPSSSTKKRKIGQIESMGEIVKSSIPVPSEIEIHLIDHSNENKICIGFKSFSELNSDTQNQIVVEILENLQEI
jgi:hypothetical protein